MITINEFLAEINDNGTAMGIGSPFCVIGENGNTSIFNGIVWSQDGHEYILTRDRRYIRPISITAPIFRYSFYQQIFFAFGNTKIKKRKR